jgi:hypothetical protein
MKVIFLAAFLAFTVYTYAADSLTCTGGFDKKGQKHGAWICRKDNHVLKKENYKHGTLRSYMLFNEKGQVTETRSRKGKVKKYNPCGC